MIGESAGLFWHAGRVSWLVDFKWHEHQVLSAERRGFAAALGLNAMVFKYRT
jgi:hypothetical protein